VVAPPLAAFCPGCGSLYPWILFLHLAGVFGFLLAHGISTGVAFRLRKERNRERISALAELSGTSLNLFYISLLLLVGAGVWLGFLVPGTWGKAWIWTAIGLLIAAIASMSIMARPYYQRVRAVATARRAGGYAASDEELDAILSSSRPIWIAVIGFGALAVILWLMIFKPF
jgi:hypothetical protein